MRHAVFIAHIIEYAKFKNCSVICSLVDRLCMGVCSKQRPLKNQGVFFVFPQKDRTNSYLCGIFPAMHGGCGKVFLRKTQTSARPVAPGSGKTSVCVLFCRRSRGVKHPPDILFCAGALVQLYAVQPKARNVIIIIAVGNFRLFRFFDFPNGDLLIGRIFLPEFCKILICRQAVRAAL